MAMVLKQSLNVLVVVVVVVVVVVMVVVVVAAAAEAAAAEVVRVFHGCNGEGILLSAPWDWSLQLLLALQPYAQRGRVR